MLFAAGIFLHRLPAAGHDRADRYCHRYTPARPACVLTGFVTAAASHYGRRLESRTHDAWRAKDGLTHRHGEGGAPGSLRGPRRAAVSPRACPGISITRSTRHPVTPRLPSVHVTPNRPLPTITQGRPLRQLRLAGRGINRRVVEPPRRPTPNGVLLNRCSPQSSHTRCIARL